MLYAGMLIFYYGYKYCSAENIVFQRSEDEIERELETSMWMVGVSDLAYMIFYFPFIYKFLYLNLRKLNKISNQQTSKIRLSLPTSSPL